MENAQEAKFKVMTESPVKPLVCRRRKKCF